MTATHAPTLIGSWNAAPAADLAVALLAKGTSLLDAIVKGINLIEDDPEEMSVGYGGLPNEEGFVELDAAVMDGPLHKAGAVAGLRGIRHSASVALQVLRRTDHALLVGDGALKFARQLGFKEEDLLTDKARDAWLQWKASLSTRDAWLGPDDQVSGGTDYGAARWAGHAANPTPGGPPPASASPKPGQSGGAPKVPFTFGTVHLSGLDASGNLYACTSTSGLSYKIPGRVGDSSVVGAGIYIDNAHGSAGCTGRGEAALQSCAAFEAVRLMEQGRTPTDAALESLKRIARNTREKRLLAAAGRPSFNVTIYALRKDGTTGAASMHEGYTHIVHTRGKTSLEKCAFLFAKS